MSVRTDQNEQTVFANGSPWDAANTTQKNELRAKICYAGGREFRYCSSKITLPAGTVVSASVPLAIVANSCTAAAIGATTVTVTSATVGSVTLDEYAGGYFCTTDDAGDADVL